MTKDPDSSGMMAACIWSWSCTSSVLLVGDSPELCCLASSHAESLGLSPPQMSELSVAECSVLATAMSSGPDTVPGA